MKRHPNVAEAKQQIQELQTFVQMAEDYKPQNLRQQVIKAYAFTFSIKKVAEALNSERADHLAKIESSFVSETIRTRPSNDPLHALIRKIYLDKTKHIRTK